MTDCCAHAAQEAGRRRWAAAPALTALLLLATPTVNAAEPAADSDPRLAPTSERYAKEEARKAIPWNKLSHADQRRVRYVVRNASLYRRLPTRVEACQPEVFGFLVGRPEVVTSTWNLMGVSPLTVERRENNRFVAKDHVGGEGVIEVLHTSRDPDARGLTLAVIDGSYQQKPMPRPIRAKCVLLLRSGSTVESNGQPYVTARLDAFVKFERVGADLVARGLQPLLAQTADHNFIETMKFVSTFSKTAESNPAGMRSLADKLTSLDATTRGEMIAVCDRAHEAATLRTAARAAEQTRLARLRSTTDAN